MSVSRLAAGVVALAIGAAVVTALAANPEVKSDLAAANSEANADPASPAAAKSDRLPIRPAHPPAPNPGATAAPASPAAAKSDRLAIRPLKPAAGPTKPAAGPVTSICPQEPWPYGCQWRTPPARKVYRAARP